jgi:hypothetical protein
MSDQSDQEEFEQVAKLFERELPAQQQAPVSKMTKTSEG